jgi:hypothetical protein
MTSLPIMPENYDNIRTGIVELFKAARSAARYVNSIMTATYWEIGRRIVMLEQGREHRAESGEQLIEQLAGHLTRQFGRGFGRAKLKQMRIFYRASPNFFNAIGVVSSTTSTLAGEPISDITFMDDNQPRDGRLSSSATLSFARGSSGPAFNVSPDFGEVRQTLPIVFPVDVTPNSEFPQESHHLKPATSAALPKEASPFLYFSTASRILPRVTRSRTAFDKSLCSSIAIAGRNS